MRELYAWFGSRLVGVFEDTGGAGARFSYDPAYADDPQATPLSLSLPLDGTGTGAAAYAYLDNLLPDNPDVRARWARERGLDGDDPFTLLSSYGSDVAGAVTLSACADPLEQEPQVLVEATDDDIAARIATLGRETTAWLDPRARARMSLAGSQGKFSLTRVRDRWFWPTDTTPSTHIFKPPSLQHRNIDLFEHLALVLAREVGLVASRSSRDFIRGQSTFIVERWDRYDGARLHAEDLNQALGNRTGEKYNSGKAGAPVVARLLGGYGLEYQFVRQLAFNAALGNADAHAKNYSILLSGPQVALAPLYDALPVYFWPKYDTALAMPIGSARFPADMTEPNWREFAAQAGLDPDRVCQEAFTVISDVADHYEAVFAAGGTDSARMMLVAKRVRILRRLGA